MSMSGRMLVSGGISLFVPNDTIDLEDDGCYVSYNSDNRYYGSDTTALVRMNGVQPTKFLILNGNHMEEYAKLKTYDACLEYFKEHLDEKNVFSENWDEDLIRQPDGKYKAVKVVN